MFQSVLYCCSLNRQEDLIEPAGGAYWSCLTGSKGFTKMRSRAY